MPRRTNSSKIN